MADTFTFEETPETKQAFADFVTRLTHITPTELGPVTDAIKAGFADNFENESAGSRPWKELKYVTVTDRIRLGFGGEHPILQRTRSYLESFQGGGDHIENITADSDGLTVEVGSRHWLSGIHELGAGRIPARSVTILSQDAERRVFDEIDKLFLRLLSE